MIDPEDVAIILDPEHAAQRLADAVQYLTAARVHDIDRARPSGDTPAVNARLLGAILELMFVLLDEAPGGRDAKLAELGMRAARALAGLDE